MGRKKIWGKTIGFRLPLDQDKIFRENAKAEGLSPGEYARKLS